MSDINKLITVLNELSSFFVANRQNGYTSAINGLMMQHPDAIMLTHNKQHTGYIKSMLKPLGVEDHRIKSLDAVQEHSLRGVKGKLFIDNATLSVLLSDCKYALEGLVNENEQLKIATQQLEAVEDDILRLYFEIRQMEDLIKNQKEIIKLLSKERDTTKHQATDQVNTEIREVNLDGLYVIEEDLSRLLSVLFAPINTPTDEEIEDFENEVEGKQGGFFGNL